jgi:hypothetical protein
MGSLKKRLLRALQGQREALIIRYEDFIQVLDGQNKEVYRTKKLEKLEELIKLGKLIKKAQNRFGDEYYYLRLE